MFADIHLWHLPPPAAPAVADEPGNRWDRRIAVFTHPQRDSHGQHQIIMGDLAGIVPIAHVGCGWVDLCLIGSEFLSESIGIWQAPCDRDGLALSKDGQGAD